MKKQLIIAGLVAALAVPTVAIAAGHQSAKTQAKGSRSALAVKMKPSKSVPASASTKASAKPKARTHAGRNPRGRASAGTARTSVKTKRNKTAGTPGMGVTLTQGSGSVASGNQGVGGLGLPTIGGTSV